MSVAEKRYLSAAETAKLVRKALKAEFPGVKFSVRSSNYAGGASISVGWTDGPTSTRVDEVLSLYSGASFDGMIDLKSYHDSLLIDEDGAVEAVHFGADFVHSHRRISDGWQAELEAEVSAFAGLPYEGNRRYEISGYWGELAHDSHQGEWGYTLVHQLAQKRER